MNKRQVKERLSEFSGICQHTENDENSLLEVALFVEDVFGIALSDNEICKKNLGTHNAIEKFIVKKLQL
jgi:acyl carrier protein